MPYQADFGEELESWLQDEESGGHRVKGTQTPTPVLPETSPEVADKPSNEVTNRPFDPGRLRTVMAQIWRARAPLSRLPLLDGASGHVRSQTGTPRCEVYGLR